MRHSCDTAVFDLAPRLRAPCRMPQIVIALEIQPQLGGGIKGARKTQCHLWRYGTAFMNELGQGFPRHPKASAAWEMPRPSGSRYCRLRIPPGCTGERVRSLIAPLLCYRAVCQKKHARAFHPNTSVANRKPRSRPSGQDNRVRPFCARATIGRTTRGFSAIGVRRFPGYQGL
jgi:hypothetical protein